MTFLLHKKLPPKAELTAYITKFSIEKIIQKELILEFFSYVNFFFNITNSLLQKYIIYCF